MGEYLDSMKADRAKVPFDEAYCQIRGPDGIMISKTEYQSMTKNGCFACGKILTLNHEDDLTWDEEYNPYCRTCVDLSVTMKDQAKDLEKMLSPAARKLDS